MNYQESIFYTVTEERTARVNEKTGTACLKIKNRYRNSSQNQKTHWYLCKKSVLGKLIGKPYSSRVKDKISKGDIVAHSLNMF
jgi:hypothetical protein